MCACSKCAPHIWNWQMCKFIHVGAKGKKKKRVNLYNRESWAASAGTWLHERGSHCVVGLMRLCAESGCWVTEMIYGSRMDSRRGEALASPQSCCRGRRARHQSGSHRAGAVSRARVESVEADWRRWAEGYGQVQRKIMVAAELSSK